MFVYVLIPIIFAAILFKVKLEALMKFKIIKSLSNISFEIYLSQGISMCIFRGPYLHLESDYLYVVLTLAFTIIIAMLVKYIRKTLLHYCP